MHTFPLHRSGKEAAALVDVVGLLVKLQSGFVLGVVDANCSTNVSAQQCIHRHAQLHVKALHPLEPFIVIDDDVAHLGVLALIKLNLWSGLD